MKKNFTKKYIFVAEYGSEINEKVVMTFRSRIIGEWVLELLNNKIHFRIPSYFDTYYECFEEEWKELVGQTNVKFCFHDIKTMEDINYIIEQVTYFRKEWLGQYIPNKKYFDDKIKKIILLQNKCK